MIKLQVPRPLGGSRKQNPEYGTLYYHWGFLGNLIGVLVSRSAQGSG